MLRRQLLRSWHITAQPFFSSTTPSSLSQGRTSSLNASNLLQIIRNSSTKRAAPLRAPTPTTTTTKPDSLLKIKNAPPPTQTTARFRRFDHEISKLGGSGPIFKAPPHGGYIAGTYTVAAFCFFYTGYNFYATSINPLVELATWHKYLFAGICMGMGAMGAIVTKRGSRLIASINATTTANNQTQLTLKIRRMAPFLKQRTIVTTPAQISFSRPLRGAADERTNAHRLMQQQRMSSQNEVARAPFYKMPLKKISFWSWRHTMSLRRILSQDYFIFVYVDGHKDAFRMDTLGEFSPQYFHLESAAMSS